MSKTYFQLISAAALFAIVLIGYALWYHALGSVSGELADLSAKVAAQNRSAAQAIAAEDELAKLSAEEGAIHGYFVSTSDIVSFLEALQKTGSALGAKVSVTSVSANAAPRPHLDLALTISGSFDAVMRTIGAIEYGPHDIVVKTLTVDSGTSADGSASAGWTAALALQVGTASSSPALPPPATTTAATTTP